MAAITPTVVYRESLGSLTLIINTITTVSASDTYTLAPTAPVLSFWMQSSSGSGLNEPDVTYAASTGVFTLTSGTIFGGTNQFFILMRT